MWVALAVLCIAPLPFVVGYLVAATGGMYQYEAEGTKVRGTLSPVLTWCHFAVIFSSASLLGARQF